MKIGRLLLLFILGVFVLSSCRKEDQIFEDSNATLNFSTDSITFDTVFTTVGTVTKNFRVYNPYKETVRISSIRLKGGQGSEFRLNVDGQPGPYHENVEIAPKDSMYIFVEATIDPNDTSKPFVRKDFIQFNTNSNRQIIDLVAWGQNAIYYTPTTQNDTFPNYSCLTGPNNTKGPCGMNAPSVNATWTDSLPIVIYGYVRLENNHKLTIKPGTKVYFHNNSGLWASKGSTIKVEGEKDNPVLFRGDRLEPAYDDIPGQWDRIWINEGGVHEIDYAIIKNAFIGIQAEIFPIIGSQGISDRVDLNLSNTIIDNCSGFGLLSAIANIEAENLVISDCGQYNAVIQGTGNYTFTHCTFANYYNAADRETPAFFAQNSWVSATGGQLIDTVNVNIYNSIIYGDLESEFQSEIAGNGKINFDMQNTIIKTDQATSDTSKFKNIIRNPGGTIFTATSSGDYHLSSNSVAIDEGDINFVTNDTLKFDLDGVDRTADVQPDLGAYEATD